MFTKNYTIVIDSKQDNDLFRKFISILSSHGDIKKLRENAENDWTIIKMESSGRRWNKLLGRLKDEMDLTPYKIEGIWFI